MKRLLLTISSLAILYACADHDMEVTMATFEQDLAFLEKHSDAFALSNADGSSQVVVVPAMQGRIMTSTLAGPGGLSLGWINRELIASGKTLAHINPYGGEDRFWLGPEGGQFALFFKNGAPFDLEHWYTPHEIDTEPFDLVSQSQDQAVITKTMQLENYSGTKFELDVTREVRLLNEREVSESLGISLDSTVQFVAFESDNKITNTGKQAWIKESGLLSIWILGMFNPSATTTIVIPFLQGPEDSLAAIVNDAYFGKVPPERLLIKPGVLYFKGDGQYRSKIGLSPLRAKSILGSYDAANNLLTLVQYTKPEGVTDYVNSMWEIQKQPYAGDAVNSYNDGPPAPGAKPLGPFYELETSSPAAALQPGESLSHVHKTFHFQAPEQKLDEIARLTLGVSLDEIKSALK